MPTAIKVGLTSQSTELTTLPSEALSVSAFFLINDPHHWDKEHEKFLLRTTQTPSTSTRRRRRSRPGRKKWRLLPIAIDLSYADPLDVPAARGLYDYYHRMQRRQNKYRNAGASGLYALRTTNVLGIVCRSAIDQMPREWRVCSRRVKRP